MNQSIHPIHGNRFNQNWIIYKSGSVGLHVYVCEWLYRYNATCTIECLFLKILACRLPKPPKYRLSHKTCGGGAKTLGLSPTHQIWWFKAPIAIQAKHEGGTTRQGKLPSLRKMSNFTIKYFRHGRIFHEHRETFISNIDIYPVTRQWAVPRRYLHEIQDCLGPGCVWSRVHLPYQLNPLAGRIRKGLSGWGFAAMLLSMLLSQVLFSVGWRGLVPGPALPKKPKTFVTPNTLHGAIP